MKEESPQKEETDSQANKEFTEACELAMSLSFAASELLLYLHYVNVGTNSRGEVSHEASS